MQKKALSYSKREFDWLVRRNLQNGSSHLGDLYGLFMLW